MADRTLDRLLVVLGINKAEFDAGLAGVQRTLQQTSRSFQQMGRSLTLGVTAPLAAVGGLAAREFASYEEALAGVARETDAGAARVGELGARISKLATQIPVARKELLGIAEAALELGAPIEGIETLTETAARFGSAAKLAGTEAVGSIVKLSKAFGEPIGEANKLTSAILALEGPEQTIIEIGEKTAATGRAIGLATAETLAFAAAGAKLGAGAGSAQAIQRLFEEIAVATAEGGDKLRLFAEVADESGAALRQAFETDAAGAIVEILEGLDRMRASGANVLPVLKELGLGSVRARETILALASSTGDLREGLAKAIDAFRRGDLVVSESEKFYATLNSQLTKLRSAFSNVAGKLGEALAPALEAGITKAGELADRLAGVVERFNAADASTKIWVGSLAALAASIGPVLLGLGLLASAASAGITGLTALAGAIVTVRTALLGLFVTAGPVLGAFTLNPIGLAIVGLAAATAVGVKAWSDWKRATKDAVDAAASSGPELANLGDRFKDVADQAGNAATRARSAAKDLSAAALQLERFRVEQGIRELPTLGLGEAEAGALGGALLRRRDEVQRAIDELVPPTLAIAVTLDEATRREALAAAGLAAEEIEAALGKAGVTGAGAGASVSKAAAEMAQALHLAEQQAALLGRASTWQPSARASCAAPSRPCLPRASTRPGRPCSAWWPSSRCSIRRSHSVKGPKPSETGSRT